MQIEGLDRFEAELSSFQLRASPILKSKDRKRIKRFKNEYEAFKKRYNAFKLRIMELNKGQWRKSYKYETYCNKYLKRSNLKF